MSLVNIQKILGHSSLETTQRYLCTSNPDDPKRRAIQEAAARD